MTETAPLTLKVCPRCGFRLSLLMEVVRVPSASWAGMVAILSGEFPETSCPRCKHALPISRLVGFGSTVVGEVVVLHPEDMSKDLLEQLRQEAERTLDLPLVPTTSEGRLQQTIHKHVFSYKSILRDLGLAHADDRIDEFLDARWRELIPDCFAAGIVAYSGLVPGIGMGIRSRDDPSAPVERALERLLGLFGHYQRQVWLRMVKNTAGADYDLETGLREHVRMHALFPDKGELEARLRSALELVRRGDAGRGVLYPMLALHATVCALRSERNAYEILWASEYLLRERMELEESVPAEVLGWRVAPERGRATISEKACWNAIAEELNALYRDSLGEGGAFARMFDVLHGQLGAITAQLGYEGIFDRVLGSINFRLGDQPPEAMVEVVLEMIETGTLNVATAGRHLLGDLLLRIGDVTRVSECFRRLLPLAPDGEQRAALEAWYGRVAKTLRAPSPFLQAVGTTPRDWEQALPLEVYVDLNNERSNALRLLGRPHEALAVTDDLLRRIEEVPDLDAQRFVLAKNRGILLRESGRPGEALRVLAALLERAPLDERPSLLESCAVTCYGLSHHERAIVWLRDALKLLGTSLPDQRERIELQLALHCSLSRRHDEALEILASREPTTIHGMASAASAYFNLAIRDAKLSDEQHEHLQQYLAKISRSLDVSAQGDLHWFHQAIRMLNSIRYTFDMEGVEETLQWEVDYRAQRGNEDPEPIAQLASIKYGRRNPVGASALVQTLPQALARRFGAIEDLASSYDATIGLRAALLDLTENALGANAPWPEVRLIAEVRRDVIGGASLARRSDHAAPLHSLRADLSDAAVSRLMEEGVGAVLEWCSTREQLFCMLTTLEDTGVAVTMPLDLDGLDLFPVRTRIMHKLGVWHEGRPGDPFEDRSWRAFEERLQQRLEPRVPDGRHVIVLDHGSLVGIPWHAALGRRWPCSYAPSWTSLSSPRAWSPGTPVRLGTFAAPRFRESAAIRDAMARCIAETSQWTARDGHEHHSVDGVRADREALEALMRDCDVVTLICHGYADAGALEVALLVSHDGELAPTYAPGSTEVDPHRMSWRDLQALQRAAPVVLSVACSTGLQWQAGAGEQLGLYGALRRGGTRAFIGPRWDVVASAVLPILDETLRARAREGITLIDALHGASRRADDAGVPRWLAWSLALEGSWI